MAKSKQTHTPYTYLIGWSEHNTWYYGVRYEKGCHPSDLWVEYKTSSKYVDAFVLKYGDPDVIQPRKTFSSVTDARLWEEKVLKRMNVVADEKWLNKTDNRSIDPSTVARGENHWTYNNKEHSERWSGDHNPMKIPEIKAKISGDNHYTRLPDYDGSFRKGENSHFKRPEVKAKISGDNHYTRQPGYDNSNHYAKRPEAREKRALLNTLLHTGRVHRKVSCIECRKEMGVNNIKKHLAVCPNC